MSDKQQCISIKNIINRFFAPISFTWGLVILEGITIVSLPAAIGYAVNDLLKQSTDGIIVLGTLCALLLTIGASRRLYDTRIYGKIYSQVATDLVGEENAKCSSLSKISARAGLFTEFIDFLEHSLPDIFLQIIGLLGALFIILLTNSIVFLACLACLAVVLCVYTVSEQRIYRLTKASNNQLERQVDTLALKKASRTKRHFEKLVFWRIRLSDLETVNFSLIWAAFSATLVFTVITVSQSSDHTLGELVATVMYVYGLAESLMTLPVHYQQMIRLREIATRLHF